jgi:Flp pilus assembly pilin Flp
MTMNELIARVLRDERGQDLVEYALLLGIITIGAAAAVTALGGAAIGNITQAKAALSSAGG